MTPSDADEAPAQDDDGSASRRRSRRDVLDVGRGGSREARYDDDDRRGDGERRRGRGAAHPRDLDEDEGEDNRRDRDRRSRGDRNRDERDRGEQDRDDRDRDDRRRYGESRYEEGRRGDRDGGRDRSDRGGGADDRDTGGQRPDAGKGDAPSADPSKGGASSADQPKGGENAANKDSPESQERRKSRRPLILTIVAIVALLLIGYGVYYYLTHKNLVTTDDAYTDGDVVAVAPRVSGAVVSLDVTDNQFVHKGDPLIHIDPRPFLFARDQAKGQLDALKAQVASQRLGVEIAKKNFPASLQLAQANLLQAKANLNLQESNNRRQQNLPKQATTQQDVDQSASSQQQAEAQVAQAQARVTQAEPVQQNVGQSEQQVSQLQGQQEQEEANFGSAELNVEFTVVRAAQDGWVTRRNVDVGNYVSSGTQIMSMVTTKAWVTANYKETELDGMRPGQSVSISVDAFPDLKLTGHVDSIQHGSGSKFSAFPAENATGNFVKIVQRVPVKIIIDSGLKAEEPLPLGVSVEPTVMLR